jgi:hypothetical protein
LNASQCRVLCRPAMHYWTQTFGENWNPHTACSRDRLAFHVDSPYAANHTGVRIYSDKPHNICNNSLHSEREYFSLRIKQTVVNLYVLHKDYPRRIRSIELCERMTKLTSCPKSTYLTSPLFCCLRKWTITWSLRVLRSPSCLKPKQFLFQHCFEWQIPHMHWTLTSSIAPMRVLRKKFEWYAIATSLDTLW